MNKLGVSLVVLLGACDHFKSPDRIKELDRRVDELSAVVSAMKGEPVGVGKDEHEEGVAHASTPADDHGDKKQTEHDDKKGEKKKAEKSEKHEKSEKSDAHEDKEDEHAEEVVPKKKKGPVHWGYEGELGPEHWGDLSADFTACKAGGEQSPIDIEPRKGKSSVDFSYTATGASVVDNGHTLQVNLDPGSSIEIDGTRYDLLQFHVHTPSEHTIAGDRFPMEVHLVHKSEEGKLAVVGVLYDVGDASATLDKVWKKWPSKPNQPKALSGKLDPSTLLPDNRSVFRYEGSLTTPPCTEGVVWNVMRRTRTDSQAHLDLFKTHYANNARPVATLGDRDVE
jgi:carbonic anhydrase